MVSNARADLTNFSPNRRPKKTANRNTTPKSKTLVQGTLQHSTVLVGKPTTPIAVPVAPNPAVTPSSPLRHLPMELDLGPDSPPALKLSSSAVSIDLTLDTEAESATSTADLEDDVILAKTLRTRDAATAAHRASRKTLMDAANAAHVAQFVYVYHTHHHFKISTIATQLKTKSDRVWSGSIVPTHFASKKAGADKKSVADVVLSSVPSPFAWIYPGRKWKEGTKAEFIHLAEVCLTRSATWANEPKGQQLRHCLIGLARMTPEHFDSFYVPSTGSVVSSPETLTWIAANTVLGSHWRMSTIPPKPKSPPAPRVGFAALPPTTKTSAGTFLHQSGSARSSNTKDWKAAALKQAPRPYSSFFTLVLPELTDTGPALADAALKFLHEALAVIWKADKSLALYIFPTKLTENSRANPLLALPTFASGDFTRRLIDRHTYQLFLRKGRRPYVRFFAGHTIPSTAFATDSFLRKLDDRDIEFFFDPIQAPTTTICGWLLGTHRSLNLKHYSTLMQANPKFNDFPVTLTNRPVKMFFEENTKGKEIRAAHVLCDEAKRSATNKLLKAQYNRFRADDIATLPDGKYLKYVTYYANKGDRRPTPTRYREIQMCRVKQAQFTEKHSTSKLLGILDLDLALRLNDALGYVSLRQVLLGIKTQSNWTWPLFVSVDFDDFRGEIVALFHIDNDSEAREVISFLPIFLEARYGAKIWHWFSIETKATLDGNFRLNQVTGKIEEINPDVDEYATNLFGGADLADWEQVDDADIGDTALDSVTFDLGKHFDLQPRQGGAGFDDGQSLKTFNTATSNATLAANELPLENIEGNDIALADDHTHVSSLSNAQASISSTSSAPASLLTGSMLSPSVPQTGLQLGHG